MDFKALLTIFLIILGFVWALWIIFKKEALSQNLVKLLSYFIGVVITFIIIGWLVDNFLPWWTAQRLVNTRNSPNLQTIEDVGREVWDEAMGGLPVGTAQPTITSPTVQPPITFITPMPGPTASPLTTPTGNISSQGATKEVTYVVVSGDTLYSLGRKFGVSADKIKTRNNLTSDLIQVGQTLIIPLP